MKEILLTSSALILVLLALRRLFRKVLSGRAQYALWGWCCCGCWFRPAFRRQISAC